ncbi:MAG: S24/S26 family peptidase [Rhizomicrobium sp.]
MRVIVPAIRSSAHFLLLDERHCRLYLCDFDETKFSLSARGGGTAAGESVFAAATAFFAAVYEAIHFVVSQVQLPVTMAVLLYRRLAHRMAAPESARPARSNASDYAVVSGMSMYPVLRTGAIVEIEQLAAGDTVQTGEIAVIRTDCRTLIHRVLLQFMFRGAQYAVEKGDGELRLSIVSQKDIFERLVEDDAPVAMSQWPPTVVSLVFGLAWLPADLMARALGTAFSWTIWNGLGRPRSCWSALAHIGEPP